MNHLARQVVRFLLVGALNTMFSYMAYACLLRIGFQYAFASFGALLLGILFSFHTQGVLVFGNRSRRLIFRFAIGWIAIYLFNVIVIGILVNLGLDPYASGAIAILPMTVLSFLIQKFLVFRTPAPQSLREPEN